MAERKVHAACLKRGNRPGKGGKLHLGHRRIRCVGLCKMREDALHAEVADAGERCHAVKIVRCKAEAVHAGIDFDMDIQRGVLRQKTVELIVADGGAQGSGVFCREHRLTDVAADEQVGIFRQRIAEDQNADIIAVISKCHTHLLRLRNRGDGEKIRAGGGQRPCTLPCTVAVGIRLDDTADAAVGERTHGVEIVNQML